MAGFVLICRTMRLVRILRAFGGANMFGRPQIGQKVGVFFYKSSIKTIGKRVVKMVVKTPSMPVSIGVYQSRGSAYYGFRQTSPKGGIDWTSGCMCPLGPLAVVGGVADGKSIRWWNDFNLLSKAITTFV